MKVVVIREHGDLDRLQFEKRSTPEPGPMQVLVRVKACSVNHLDTWVRRGVEGHEFPLPLVPGSDTAGVVEAIGAGTTNVKVGDEIVVAPGYACYTCEQCARGEDALCRRYGIFGESCDGGCAEFMVAPARNCLPKPKNLTFIETAAMPLVFLTAWHMLVARAGIRPGMDVLVHAAGSGVSTAAIQIAKLFGARVIATAGSDAKVELARELGADVAINYREQDFNKAVKEFTNRKGVEIAIDHVGEPTVGKSLLALARGGALVNCGVTAGFRLEADLRLIFFKGLSILGSTMGSLAEVHQVMRLAEQGQLKPVIHKVLPLDEIREAHRILGDREVFGKVVVTP